jgi:hypothetical protein
MNFQYSITYTNESNEIASFKNFNNKKNLIQFLDANKNQLSSLKGVRINFKSISLSLRDTVWKS